MKPTKMNPLINLNLINNALFLTIVSMHLFICNAFILFSHSSASSYGNAQLFDLNSGYLYQLTTTIILNESEFVVAKGKDVGYQIQCDVIVGVPWQNPNDKNEKLFEMKVSFYFHPTFDYYSF